jgi:hemoglobin
MRKQEAVPMATQDSPNLYERLGGIYSIATVVDDLIDRVMADPRLNANPLVDDAHHKVPPAGFKYLVTEMLCWAAGGPQKYTGKDMESSHRHLRITPGEWDAFMDDVAQHGRSAARSARPDVRAQEPVYGRRPTFRLGSTSWTTCIARWLRATFS